METHDQQSILHPIWADSDCQIQSVRFVKYKSQRVTKLQIKVIYNKKSLFFLSWEWFTDQKFIHSFNSETSEEFETRFPSTSKSEKNPFYRISVSVFLISQQYDWWAAWQYQHRKQEYCMIRMWKTKRSEWDPYYFFSFKLADKLLPKNCCLFCMLNIWPAYINLYSADKKIVKW